MQGRTSYLSPPPPGGARAPPSPSSDTPTTSTRPALSSRKSSHRGKAFRNGTAAASTQPQIDEAAESNWQEWDKHAADLNWDWVVEEDMKVLADALSDEPDGILGGDATPGPPGGAEGIEKIRAVSDFAPIKERIRRGPKRRKDVVREGWSYHVSRWPLLGLIFTIIFFEFCAYIFVRQMVNIVEFFSGWRGERGKLRVALRNAKSYEEWRDRALDMDRHLGLEAWKSSPQNAYYDAPLVRRVLRALRDLRSKDDAEGVAAVLHAVLRSNFAGTESFRLYSETFYGTKRLVQEYVDEVTDAIEYIRHAPPSLLSVEEKADFFRSVSKNLGSSALCLSGGASFGYYHFGVVRALLDQDVLPRVVTGTSAGAIVAAFLCTRTNEELRRTLTPALADRITACEDSLAVWLKRAWKTGARFDTVQWARKASFFSMGSMTFREAYERTGRVLNVSVIPYETHSPTKLLNYLTAPDCVIYTAVISSAAVPGILNPVVLLTKDKNGKLHPWEFQGKHKDGSLRVDIPLHSLHLLYNVNFSIVSQVNPHIHLFNFAPRGSPGRPVAHRKGKGWRGGFWLAAGEQFWKIEMVKWFRVIRDLELLPELGGQNWSAVFLQKFEGTVTIWPKSRFSDWFRLLTDPDRKELARMIRVGQLVTWPKIKMIENRLKIERQIDLGRDEIRQQLAAGATSTSDPLRPQLTHHESSSSAHHIHPRAPRRSRSKSKSPFPHPDIDRDETFASRDPERDEDSYSSSGVSSDSEEEHQAVAATLLSPNNGSGNGTPTPAKRRHAILKKLGLGRVANGQNNNGANGNGSSNGTSTNGDGPFSLGNDASGRDGQGADGRQGRSGGAGGKRWTDESDWTSGGESADGLAALGAARKATRQRRGFSMSAVDSDGTARRRRAATLSSDEDGGGRWR